MANAFLSETDTGIGTSPATILTCGASTETTIIGLSGERHEELGGVGFALEVAHAREHPPEHVVDGLLVAVDHVPAEVRVEVRWIAQHLQEPAHPLLRLILRLLLQVHGLVFFVQRGEHLVDEFEQF